MVLNWAAKLARAENIDAHHFGDDAGGDGGNHEEKKELKPEEGKIWSGILLLV